MSTKPLPTLEQLIRSHIQKRIVAALILLIGTVTIATILEGFVSVSNRIETLKSRAKALQDQVVSEIMVHNREAIDAIIADANSSHTSERVEWQESPTSRDGKLNDLKWDLNGDWSFDTPLRGLDGQNYGLFRFSGNLFSDDFIVYNLSRRAVLSVFFCLILAWLLLPVASKAPTELMLQPMRHLLALVNSGDGPLPSTKNPKFSEASALEKEVVNLLMDREEAKKREFKAQKDAAIAQMTSMLAHDVRKPFSMLKTGLNLLQATSNDPNKFRNNLAFLISEVERATKSVDGMLTDVMEIGSTSTELIQEPTSPEVLIESTLGEAFRIYPKSKIAIGYDLKHSVMVHVHLKKVSRIFSNIVGNAVQAMNYSGSMWFKTQLDGDFVKFCIGNAGSMIPPESLAKLFEAFFTSGKKGGTGLGLAIAQKVVQAHGGKIWCESSKTPEHPDGKVEFFFTLPIAKGADFVTTASLPRHSDEITRIIVMMGQALASKSDSEFNKSESLLHQEVIQRAGALSRPLGLLIVDDESIYRTALAGWIEESPELTKLCNIFHANGSFEAFEILNNQSIDLIITDIDMGPKSLSGFDLVKELRTTHDFKGQIFVHSNRIVPDDHRKAGDLGANGFLPKPMAKGQLYKLFLQTFQWLSPLEDTVTPSGGSEAADSDTAGAEAVASSSPGAAERGTKSPFDLIAVIDDEDIFRDQWPAFLKGFDTVCYATAEDFVKDWDRVSGRLLAVLTDKYLGSGIDGIKLGTMLRQKAPDLAIFLSTSDVSVKNDSNVFDLTVDKDAFEEAPKITRYLKTKAKDESLARLMRKTIRVFDSNARDLDESHDLSSIVASHILGWEFLLKDLDQATKTKLEESMLATEREKLKHDIKGSISRLKILLRNLENGDMDLKATMGSLESRVADCGRL